MEKVLAVLVLLSLLKCSQSALIITFTKVPQSPSRFRNALFAFVISDENGRDVCKNSSCILTCQIDTKVLQTCSSAGTWVRNVMANQDHTFSVKIIAVGGEQNSSYYKWFVDTVRPTASIIVGEKFTKSTKISVNISFSEICPGNGGFKCSVSSQCDLRINGPGVVELQSLKQVDNGLNYIITVSLSMHPASGRVVLSLQRSFCTDKAGNIFTRNANSTFVIRYDRRPVHANISTAIPQLQLSINHVLHVIQASNHLSDLIVFVDFSSPIANSSEKILNALQPSIGLLRPIKQRSHGSKHFSFQLTDLPDLAVISIRLETSSLISKSGMKPRSPQEVVFLYDIVRPQVHLSTISPAKTKDYDIGVLIEFDEPVFGFSLKGVVIHNGRLSRFKELSKTMYVVNILVALGRVTTISVPESKAYDIAGNTNMASNLLQVRHYSTPSLSFALSSLITAGLLATSLASSVFSISSTALGAAGVFSRATSSSIVADPSRNLLGMIGHIQVFAFSSWLSVGLPVEYYETTRGLRWLIPHARLPWKHQGARLILFDPELVIDNPIISPVNHNRTFTSIMDENHNENDYSYAANFFHSPLLHERDTWVPNAAGKGHHFPITFKDQKLGMNNSISGPALHLDDYHRYFMNQSKQIPASKVFHGGKRYTGWEEFGMNMFWLCAVGGTLILLHILILLFLKWRMKSTFQGALVLPRFEIFILMLTLPCMCQASSYVVRGGTTSGVVVGVVLLALPAAFLLSVFIFLAVAVFMGELTQYKEVVYENGEKTICNMLSLVVGKNSVGKWFRKEGVPSSFLPRFGILFEDRKGPAKFVHVSSDNPRSIPRWIDSGARGIGRMKAINNSDDDTEDIEISHFQKVSGSLRSTYIVFDLMRRVTIGILFGAYPLTDHSWSQTILAFCFTATQLLYLLLLKPYIKRGVQMVEIISLICESAIFALGFVLLADGEPYKEHKFIGIAMLLLLFVSFLSQLFNEWYALINELMRLCPPSKTSLKQGIKLLLQGLCLPLLPRNCWSKIITIESSQPKTGLSPVVPFSTEERRDTEDPPVSGFLEHAPTYQIGSSSYTDSKMPPPTTIQNETYVPVAGEIKNASSSNAGQMWSPLDESRALEEMKSKAIKTDSRTNELKALRELAKASFPSEQKVNESPERQEEPSLLGVTSSSMPDNVKICEKMLKGSERSSSDSECSFRKSAFPSIQHNQSDITMEVFEERNSHRQ